jgi:hypothetical protein
MIGTAVLVGEVAAGPARRLIAARKPNPDQPNPASSIETT